MTRQEKFERLLARGNTSQLVDYVTDNNYLFKSLINTYIQGPNRITRQLAGALIEIALSKPDLLRPHWRRLIKSINDPGASVGLKRNTIRLMQFVPVPRTQQGNVIDLCFRFLTSKSETIAVKVFAMSVAELLSRDIPELRRELIIVVEDQLPYSGPAFSSRAANVLKALRPPAVARIR
jgi:hypothetical protein